MRVDPGRTKQDVLVALLAVGARYSENHLPCYSGGIEIKKKRYA